MLLVKRIARIKSISECFQGCSKQVWSPAGEIHRLLADAVLEHECVSAAFPMAGGGSAIFKADVSPDRRLRRLLAGSVSGCGCLSRS